MQVAELVALLDHPDSAREKLAAWRLMHPAAAHANLVSLAQNGVTLDLLSSLCEKLANYLVLADDPDRLLAELRRYFESSRSPLALASLIDRDPSAATMLLQVLDLGRPWTEVLVADPEALDLLRLTEGQPADATNLIDEIRQELAALSDDQEIHDALARIRRREWLRIAYGQVFRGLPTDAAGEQLASAAEAILQGALEASERHLLDVRQAPSSKGSSEPGQLGVLGLARFGGRALDYHGPLEIMFLCEPPRGEGTRPGYTTEHFERIARHVVQLLNRDNEREAVFTVSPHIIPSEGPNQLVAIADQALYYYDVLGRTWQRREFLAARRVAGSTAVCESFLHSLEPWLYRRYSTEPMRRASKHCNGGC